MSLPGIVIKIGADTKDAIDGINKVDKALGNTLTPVQKLSGTLANVLGPALIAGGIAAAGFAVKLGVDSVQAAIAEQAEMAKLAKSLQNLGFGAQTQAVEDWITAAMKATTYTDSSLRPSMASLVQATGDITTAQGLLTIAMDASTGSGKDLESITQALAKAANGNTASLKKMFPALTDADLASSDLLSSTGTLAKMFEGQATAAAKTWEGQLGNVSKAFGELQESFGAGFLEGMSAAEGSAGDLSTSLYDLQDPIKELGTTIGSWLATLATFAKNLTAMKKALDEFRASIEGTAWAKVFDVFGAALSAIANGPILFLIEQINRLIDAIRKLQSLDSSMPSVPSLPGFGGRAATAGATTYGAAPTYNITVTGAVDPVGVSRQIKRILATGDMRSGRGA